MNKNHLIGIIIGLVVLLIGEFMFIQVQTTQLENWQQFGTLCEHLLTK